MKTWNKFPWSNMHGFNMDWLIETVEYCKAKVDEFASTIDGLLTVYATKEEITVERKLSPDGDFTGTLANNLKTALQTVQGVDNNRDQIQYLTNQFSDGQTGLVIDGGFFEETGIKKNYNGGVF